MFFKWLKKNFGPKIRKVSDRYILPVPCIPDPITNNSNPSYKSKTVGYRKNPYSKNFVKPNENKHGYISINTSFANNDPPELSVVPEPLELPEPVTTKNETLIDETINFYETKEIYETNLVKSDEEIKEEIENTSELLKTENTSPVTSQTYTNISNSIFVMNGYGLEVNIDGKNEIVFLDTGDDKEFVVGQKVLLKNYEGPYDNKQAIIVNGTGKERTNNINEILIQKFTNV